MAAKALEHKDVQREHPYAPVLLSAHRMIQGALANKAASG
jgi:hypothetical protein